VVPIVAVSGLGFRVLEATRGGEAARITRAVGAYREQRPTGRVPPLQPNTAVAGDPDFVVTAGILEDTRPLDGYAVLLSATVDDVEWDARAALDGVLRGLSRDEFRREQLDRLEVNTWGPWGRGRSATAREERLHKRLEAWDAVWADPGACLDRFGVRYVALPAAAPADHLGAGWSCRQDGPHWRLLERTDAP
jgi:hypothetical protein